MFSASFLWGITLWHWEDFSFFHSFFFHPFCASAWTLKWVMTVGSWVVILSTQNSWYSEWKPMKTHCCQLSVSGLCWKQLYGELLPCLNNSNIIPPSRTISQSVSHFCPKSWDGTISYVNYSTESINEGKDTQGLVVWLREREWERETERKKERKKRVKSWYFILGNSCRRVEATASNWNTF